MANGVDSVDVVLAAYNGDRFLDAQIQSVFGQSCPPRRLIVRDDRSTDDTRAVLERCAARYPVQIALLDDGDGHLGSCRSFGRLLEHADADYVMLCDQDDVWLPDKIAATLQRMRQVERDAGRDCPILVHTDLVVVDASLKPICNSFWTYEKLDPVQDKRLNRLLVQNVVTGCTLMANRSLLRAALPVPAEAVIHDWWLALVAAAVGRLEYLPQPTVLYRQHNRNQVGARGLNVRYAASEALRCFAQGGFRDRLRSSQRQAQALLDRFSAELAPEQRDLVAAFAHLGECGFLHRRTTLIRRGFLRRGWLRNLGLFVGI